MKIVTHRKFRSKTPLDARHRRKWNRISLIITHIKPADILGLHRDTVARKIEAMEKKGLWTSPGGKTPAKAAPGKTAA